jgi:hypothetical protein
MSRQSVTIQGEMYEIPAPYAEGHQLSAIEAAVLNQTFSENVRNNVAARMKKRAEANEPAFTAEEVESYALSYTFEAKTVRGPRAEAVDPVEREARNLAKSAVMDFLRKKNRTFKSIAETKEARAEWLDGMIDKLLEAKPEYRENAKALVAARKAASVTVGDLEL